VVLAATSTRWHDGRGRVWTCGTNDYGQLSHSDRTHRLTLTLVDPGAWWRQLRATCPPWNVEKPAAWATMTSRTGWSRHSRADFGTCCQLAWETETGSWCRRSWGRRRFFVGRWWLQVCSHAGGDGGVSRVVFWRRSARPCEACADACGPAAPRRRPSCHRRCRALPLISGDGGRRLFSSMVMGSC
jgi:hypothetical protein